MDKEKYEEVLTNDCVERKEKSKRETSTRRMEEVGDVSRMRNRDDVCPDALRVRDNTP